MNSDSELGILRQLLHREQAFFDIEQQQAKLFEKDSFDSIKNLIFLTRKVFSLHLSILEQSNSSAPLQVLDLSELTSSSATGSTSPLHRQYQTSFIALLQSSAGLAETLSRYMIDHPDEENNLIFSFIPAIYSCFWSHEETNHFVDFLLEFPEAQRPSLARLLLVHPTFFVYLSSFQAEALILMNANVDNKNISINKDVINDEDANNNPAEVLNLLGSRLYLFPNSIKLLLRKSKDPVDFLISCVLKPIFEYPSLYGLLPFDDQRTFKNLTSNLENSKENVENLINKILANQNTIQIQPCEVSLSSIISSNEHLIYLSKEDCEIVKKTAKPTELPPLNIENGIIQIPYRHITNIIHKTTNDSDVVANDPFEALLRELVIKLDVTHGDKNIIDTLNSALTLHAGASRLQFELRLDEFKQMKKQRDAPDEVIYYIKLLTTAYEQRMKHRKATLSNSTASDVFKVQQLQSLQAVKFLEQIRTKIFFEFWVKGGSFEEYDNKIDEFCKDGKVFVSAYKSLIAQFMSFTEEKKLIIKKDQIIQLVYNRLTQRVTLSKFREYRQDLAEQDNKIHDMIETRGDAILATLCTQHSFLKIFQDKPELLGLASDHLRKAFECDSAMMIAENIDNALSTLIHVLSFQGFKEIGGDHWLPMTLILFTNVNPTKTVSLAAYMHQFFLNLPGDIPYSQSFEYNVTMTHSSSMYFLDELKKMNC